MNKERCAIISTIRQAEKENPSAPALIYQNNAMSFSEMLRRADGLAATLRNHGIKPGNRVAIHLKRSPEMIIAILGVLSMGGVYIPMDPSSPSTRIRYILEDCLPNALLSEHDDANEINLLSIPCFSPKDWLCNAPALPLSHEETAYIIYTSGSTGVAKGVVVEHSALENYLAWCLDVLPFKGEGVPLLASISFDHAITCYFPPLMKGHPLFLLPPLEGGRLFATNLLNGHYYSYVKITPSHLRMLSIDERAQLGKCTDLVMFGGERLTNDLIKQVRSDNPELAVMNHYGPTEATVGCCAFNVPTNFKGTNVPIGHPIPGVLARVVRRDGSAAESLEVGELLIGGLALAKEYHHQPEQTEQAFFQLSNDAQHPNRWYRTGDLVQINPHQEIEYIGRVDDQVKILGYRIEPAEIERTLQHHPCVREVAVIPHERNGQLELIAIVTILNECSTSESELRLYIREYLPAIMVPSRVLLFQYFPVTVSGKIDREAIIKKVMQDVLNKMEASLDQELIARFSEVLENYNIGLDDDFFELGGDSLATVEIVLWAQEKLEIPLEPAVLFKYPTVRLFSEHLRKLLCQK